MKRNNLDKVAIIGGGESLKNIDFNKIIDSFDDIIVVNKAIKDFSKAKYFVTMDYTFLNKISKKYLDNFKGVKIFIANFYHSYVKEINGKIIDTRQKYNLVYDLSKFDMIIKSYKQKPLSNSFKDFSNGNNSGFCALQLALALQYKKIYLFGFDLSCEKTTHYHDGYNQNLKEFNEKLDEYFNFFKRSLENINTSLIYNCSNKSRLSELFPNNEEFLNEKN